jgi:hypothetical protein
LGLVDRRFCGICAKGAKKMSDAAGISTLTLQQVTELISQAKSAGSNPMLVGIQIFNGLGDNVTLPGATLTLALTTSGIPISQPLAPLLNAIQSVSKVGDHVSIALTQDTEVLLNNNRIRFAQDTSFDVSEDAGNPALNNIVGLAGHKMVWVNVQSIQLTQNQGRWSVAVKTSVKTINFDLD